MIYQVRPGTDLEALKLWKGRSGKCTGPSEKGHPMVPTFLQQHSPEAIWEPVKLKKLYFSDHMRTGLSSLIKVASHCYLASLQSLPLDGPFQPWLLETKLIKLNINFFRNPPDWTFWNFKVFIRYILRWTFASTLHLSKCLVREYSREIAAFWAKWKLWYNLVEG